MGTPNRKPDNIIEIEELLSNEAFKFDFYQAVRLIDRLYGYYEHKQKLLKTPEDVTGIIFNNKDKSIKFRSRIDTSFPASDIEKISPPENEENSFEMTVNFLSIAGMSGPLPYHYTQTILDNEKENPGNKAFREFLDVFNNRLVQLYYNIRKKHRIGYELSLPENSAFADYMFSLIGMGTKNTRERLSVKDRIFLNYIGLFSNQRRSITGLEFILSDYFNIDVEANSFIGKWREIEPDQLSILGEKGQNHILGESAIIGTRIWDQEAKFELRFGPLAGNHYINFLPIEGSESFLALYELTKHYAGPEFEFDIVLIVKATEIPQTELGSTKNSLLGWTSWLPPKDNGIFNHEYLYFLQSNNRIKMELPDGRKLRLGWTVWTPDKNGKAEYIEIRVSLNLNKWQWQKIKKHTYS